MFSRIPSRPIALLEIMIVTIIWASSFVVVKLVMKEIGPLTIGGLRYFLGSLILLPFMSGKRLQNKLSLRTLLILLLLGVSAYTVGNGATFFALQYLPATTVSFMLGLVTVLVLLGGMVFLKEMPNWIQSIGFVVSVAGMGIFFSMGLSINEHIGLSILFLGMLAFATFSLLGRSVARDQSVDTLSLTAIPLAFGGGILLLIGFLFEGLPEASLASWGLVGLLALINTALGYLLYNHALRLLPAFQINVILNLSPLWTALFGWWLLAERLYPIQWAGMVVVILGTMLVQINKSPGLSTKRPVK
jgi:drug/metabolite transporter (DMT)-like permease